jgi:ZIP family zinc transporter
VHAVLAMLASTMMPEAYEEGGAVVGLLTALGFLAAFTLDKI